MTAESEQPPQFIIWPGMRVRCIAESEVTPTHGERMPVVGEVYTVRETCSFGSVLYLRLVEIVNPQHDYPRGRDECAFAANRFEPVVSE